MSAKHRTCKVCGEYKEIDNFQPQGYQCRSCRNKKQQAYWASLPEDIRKQRQNSLEYKKEYAKRNSVKIKKLARAQHLKRKFKMTVEEYDAILEKQNGVCLLCKNVCDTGNSLAVDHDHDSGKIRGLLCKNCNTALGLFKDNVDVMTRAIEYIEMHSEIKVGK